MKFRCVDEFEQLSFDDSPIVSFQMSEDEVTFTFGGATIKAGNSQNGRFQDMYCGEITLTLLQAQMKRLVKEGMKYYDADGNLQREISDEDVPEPAVESVVSRFEKGTVFTVVLGEIDGRKSAEFGIDVPQEEDEEEVDTYWFCVVFEKSDKGKIALYGLCKRHRRRQFRPSAQMLYDAPNKKQCHLPDSRE